MTDVLDLALQNLQQERREATKQDFLALHKATESTEPFNAPIAHIEAALAPTPDEIDAAILFFRNAEACFETARKDMDAQEQKLIEMVKTHGFRPDGATQSLRLIGRRNTATVTIGRTITLFQPAIHNFLGWCKRRSRMAIFGRLFTAETKYVAVEGWRDVLKSLSLSKRSEEKIASMVALCTDVKPKAASLKVEVVKPEKPARKPRAAKVGKAAA